MNRSPLRRRTPLRASRHGWRSVGNGELRCAHCWRTWAKAAGDPPERGCRRLKRTRLRRFGRIAKRLKAEGKRWTGLRDYVVRLPCLACGAYPTDPAHVKPTGRGHGDWLEDGSGNLVPLCRPCHDRADGRVPNHGGRSQFERETELDLAEAAALIGEAYQRWNRKGARS